MNQEAQDILNKILLVTVNELTSFQIAFLKARKSYLTEEQIEKYQIIFDDFVPKQAQPEEVKIVEKLPELVVETSLAEAPYTEVLLRAKKAGYKGKRKTKEELLNYIAKHS